jgi:DNA-binding LacI/PurR family transcriptional regulator
MAGTRPTLKTVASAAGVSAMTVSNAYNRPDQLSPATRERVLRVAVELGYTGPHPAGRSLRRGRADTVGVLLTERLPYAFADPGLLSFLHGLASELAEAGQALLLIPTESDPAHTLVQNAIVDALVLCSLSADDPAVAAARRRRIPLVTVGSPRLSGVPHVGIDNAHAAVEAAKHLVGLGHTRLAVVNVPRGNAADGVPARTGVRERVSGFLRTVGLSGLDPARVTVVEAEGNSRRAGERAAAGLLNRPLRTRPTAVFAVTDVLALGVLDAASALDIAVPEELSVVGFDDIDEAARSVPPLTTVSQPLFDKGRAAARLALDGVAGKPTRSPRLETHLVVRGTTAAPSRGARRS